ncbi:putative thiol peroxidase [Vibrio coralliirubri]|uniref:thiol peroxidase n=1 Tax=Vibrio coralliirubri TaxID=1516159 RepID=UPI0006311078|nr:thiol peroxidase [Vibrio coralliirubri]CDT67642.1 putative thiol peroxidase [Vibrio coralliirubri]
MKTVTFQGSPIKTIGKFIQPGVKAPEAVLCDRKLKEFYLSQFEGKKVLLMVFPSLDTPVCAKSLKNLDEHMRLNQGAVAIGVSIDSPFAFERFYEEHNIENLLSGSLFRNVHFLQNYGVGLDSGPLWGVASRAVIVVDETGTVTYSELVDEITDEPNYSEAIKWLS